MPEPYAGSHQQYAVTCETNVMIPMRDGVNLAIASAWTSAAVTFRASMSIPTRAVPWGGSAASSGPSKPSITTQNIRRM